MALYDEGAFPTIKSIKGDGAYWLDHIPPKAFQWHGRWLKMGVISPHPGEGFPEKYIGKATIVDGYRSGGEVGDQHNYYRVSSWG